MSYNKFAVSVSGFLAAALMLSSCSGSGDIADKAPDYSDKNNWAFWNSDESKSADVFIVCPTVDMGRNGNMNGDMYSQSYRNSFVGALNMELGIYSSEASIYAPFYRQASFPVYSMNEEEGEPYLQLAYNDVKDAFIYYSENCDETRPLILAGYSQGADMVIRLMSELFDDSRYSDRLAAAYAIGWRLTEEQTENYPWLRPAQGENDTGVIIMYSTEAEHVSSSPIVGADIHTYSINPLNWKTDGTYADKSLNPGACFVDRSGKITSEIPAFTGAYIDEKRGTLKVPDVSESDYPAKLFDEGVFHLYDFKFFYRSLQKNVSKRLDAFIAEQEADSAA